MITAAAQGPWPLDVPITDLARGGLSHPCVIRTSKITALDSRRATAIGDIAPADRAAITANLKALLASVLANSPSNKTLEHD